MNSNVRVLMGLDLSTHATAGVVVPSDWDLNWTRVRSTVVGRPLKRDATELERMQRIDFIAKRIVRFAFEWNVQEAWIESYAFNQSGAAHTLGELGGAVKLELMRAGIDLHVAQQSTTHKFMLGKVPHTSDLKKQAVAAAVRAAGHNFQTLDESDAFCSVNYGLSEIGAVCICQAPLESVKRKRPLRNVT